MNVLLGFLGGVQNPQMLQLLTRCFTTEGFSTVYVPDCLSFADTASCNNQQKLKTLGNPCYVAR
jgi:hypothetical protein